jgi:hypothetical protein
LRVVLCAAGFNTLLHAIAREGLASLYLCLQLLTVWFGFVQESGREAASHFLKRVPKLEYEYCKADQIIPPTNSNLEL